jgi:Phytanoyl-CoA dioxygenase (PhyH)
MTAPEATGRYSIDARTQGRGREPWAEPADFWEGAWAVAVGERGEPAALDADILGVEPVTIRVDGQAWALRVRAGRVECAPGVSEARVVDLDRAAFHDLIQERKSAFGLAIAGRVTGDDRSVHMFCAWDPVLRSVLDGRSLYRPGDVTLRALDGGPLDLDQAFELDRPGHEAAHFLAEAGFLLLKDVFTEDEMAAIDADLVEAVEGSFPDDGVSWWATTKQGVRYPCRILDFVTKSERLREVLAGPTFLSIGGLLDDGHQPGDPFGEHFSEVTAEGLVKRVDSVDGLVCLPWHKDCERGGHALYCSGLTIGICLTPVDEGHGGLDVVPGSHRALIDRSQFDAGLDLPTVQLRAARGDVTVHTSCTVHRSTHPRRSERRVVYTGFALPARPGDRAPAVDQSVLVRERADLAGHRPTMPLSTGGGEPPA